MTRIDIQEAYPTYVIELAEAEANAARLLAALKSAIITMDAAAKATGSIALTYEVGAPRRTMLQGLKAWKPKTERERIEEEADEWLHAADKADADKIALRRRDPDAASEAAEFSAIAWAKHRELSSLARQA